MQGSKFSVCVCVRAGQGRDGKGRECYAYG